MIKLKLYNGDIEINKLYKKQFKKIMNTKQLKLPNISNIFTEHADKINYSKLLNSNIVLNASIDIKNLQTAQETKQNNGKLDVSLFISRIRKYIKRFHHFILPKNVMSSNIIKLFYKQVNP